MTLSDAFLLSPVESAPGAASAASDPDRPVQRGWLLGLLLLACVLRLGMAWQLKALSDDGFYYLSMGEALSAGDYDTAFSFLSLNVYPAILAVLHGVGLDWIIAGKLWGIFVGTLLVLPLYGLVRRLFGDQNAVVACFLYAVHPNLIELAVEPVREATFWFEFVLCLWLTERACRTQSLKWFAFAGVAAMLAVHTRVEGWFLVIPLAGWSLAAWRRHHATLRSLAVGFAIWAAITPLTVAAVNLTVLRGRDHWELGRLHEVLIARDFVLRKIGARPALPPKPAPIKTATPVIDDAARYHAIRQIGFGPTVREFGRQFIHGIGPLYMVLLFVGLVVWRRQLLQSDVLPLTVTAVVVSAAIGARLMFLNDINGRYFLTAILCLMPFLAHALRWMATGMFAILQRWQPSTSRWLTAAGVLIGITLAGGIDALSARHVRRSDELAFGQWLRGQLPERARIAVDRPAMRLGYEVRGDLPKVYVTVTPESLSHEFEQSAPDVLILTTRRAGAAAYATALARAEQLGMRRARFSGAPRSADDFAVLVRAPVMAGEGPERH